MSFGKPFKAVPVRLGAHYRGKARRRRLAGAAKLLALAAGGGLAFGWAVAQDDAPLRSASVHFPNCSAARAAGAAPVLAGQPGYRPALDADGDGIACEPYRG